MSSRAGHSRETRLILAFDDWAKYRGTENDIAIFDFTKAFDSVPHQRLLHRLNYYGIRGITLQWIFSLSTP